MMPRIDVIVLTWNDGELLERAIDSALASQGVEVRVLVIDNGSDAPVSLDHDSRVEVVRNEHNRGVAGGRNQGILASGADLICLLDSDAQLEPTCLQSLSAAAADPGVGIAVPVFGGQAPEQTAGRAPSLGRKILRLCNLRNDYAPAIRSDPSMWDVDFGIGACQLIRRSTFDAVGGLDESYLFGPEDVDFCLRARRSGWRVVQVALARCHHPPRRRHRRLFTRRGVAHARAVCRHLWRHRGTARALRGASA
ncbi:MAG: glycosyltransferase family 2 protein [Acidimicrobiia bacterium]